MEKQRTNRVQTHSAHKQINERKKKRRNRHSQRPKLQSEANALHNWTILRQSQICERLSEWKTEFLRHPKLFGFFSRLSRPLLLYLNSSPFHSLHGILFFAAIKPDVNLYIFQHMQSYDTIVWSPATGKLVAKSAWCINQFHCSWLLLLLVPFTIECVYAGQCCSHRN